MGAAKDVEMVPYYVDGKYIGDYPKDFVEWATKKAEKKRQEEETAAPNDPEHMMSLLARAYAGAIFTMSTALIRKDWKPIIDFLKTAKTIEECETHKKWQKTGDKTVKNKM